MGDEYASTFEGAGHARNRQVPAPASAATPQAWNDPMKTGAMLALAHTEAGCVTCHLGERYQPGAAALNEALLTLERSGCYACHRLPGMDRTPRRGPDLRRVRAKLTQEWVTLWLADPRAIKPATWMPAFWPGRDVLRTADRATIDAIVAYLFDRSEPSAAPANAPAAGNPERGQVLVASRGCLGCHVTGADARESVSLRRTFGQPLQAVGAKTRDAWLLEWVRDPSRQSPETRMPNLRLPDSEARDIVAYLQTFRGDALPDSGPAVADDGAYLRVLQTYDRSATAETRALTGTALRAAAGRAAIDALGCFNCHEIRGFENRTTTVPIRSRQHWDEAALRTLFPHSAPAAAGAGARDGDAAASTPGLAVHPGPDFRFAPVELERLSLALTAVAGRDTQAHALSTPWHLARVAGRTLMQERNCVGCHPVEDTGGDLVKLVAEPTLGPPLLTPEGARVQAGWLRTFLHEPQTVRPWLDVRMPTFGLSDDDVERVGTYLRGIAPENPAPAAAPAGVTAESGKALFDLLKCQQCHVLGSIPKDQPTSNLAPDLRLARERLQPDWILSWLRNPGAILPGTRMPSFWPDYPKSFYEPLEKDGAKQVRAIRDHLLTLR
jgi:mono/diheme cytochrome c family protein